MEDRVLTIGLPGGPASLDPSKDSQTFGIVRPLTNEPLTHEAPDGSIEPALATSWKYTDDEYKVFEFTLRETAMFSDGTPVDAKATVAWLRYFSQGSGIFVSAMGPIASIEAVDQHTVRLTLERSNPRIPYLLSENGNWGAVSSTASIEDPGTLETSTSGAGPYMLDAGRTISDNKYVLVPNPHYDRPEAAPWKEVVVDIIPDANARLQAQQTGQIDVAWGDLRTADAAQDAGLEVLGVPTVTGGLILGDRSSDGPLGDVRVRRALNYAVDREAVADGLVGEHGVTTSQMQSRDGFDQDYREFYPYDVDRARELLEEAGYGDDLTLEVLAFGPGGDLGTPLAQAIASYWSELGIDVKITTAPTAAEYVEKRASNRYAVLHYSVINWPMYLSYQIAMAPTGGQNPFGASDPVMNSLFDEGARTDDPDIWAQMSRRSVEEAYFVPTLTVPRLYYVSDGVEGVALTEQRPEFSWASEWSPR
ncbi:ABC transporter substrate-binding protein [Nocardioides sp. LHD-245]|uniref:ABC transporter substrate-binding protein n=1 Tax=Nocardioides sp. LHD-245 TaxID=3051387 RepID=UPI0027E1F6BC|nr:ABC transporter substrate-binding protein [Nocardioides sp. LHD-245]